jgi:hypothetical protein
MASGLVASGSDWPLPLLTHDEIVDAYDVFDSHGDGCLKVAIKP